MRRAIATATLGGALVFGGVASAQDSPFKFKPVILDSSDSEGAALGLEYDLEGELRRQDLAAVDDGDDLTDPTVGAIVLDYKGSGTLATSADRNPKNFLDLRLGLGVDWSGPGYGSVRFRAFAKVEADQAFDSQQWVLGARTTYAKADVLQTNDAFAVDFGVGRVEPGEDKARQTALGTTSLDPYDRFDVEVLYSFPLKIGIMEELELNYRQFREVDAADPIRAAGLGDFSLATARLGLKGGLFVAYSEGKLPFDRTNDQIFELGWSYDLF